MGKLVCRCYLSENCLVVSARDASQADLLVRRYVVGLCTLNQLDP
jgi:hypothetical protein